jgi:hypothetical protein
VGEGNPSPTRRTWVSDIIIANNVDDLGLGHHHRQHRAGTGSRSSSSPAPWRTWVSDIVIANTVEDLGLRHGHPHKTFATGILRGPSPRTSSPGGAGSGRDEEMKSMLDSIMITNLEDAGYPKDPSLPASLLPSLPHLLLRHLLPPS